MKNLDAILSPKSIAVVGATNRTNSIGLAVFTNIINAGYKGVLYPVNPKAQSVRSVRAYPRIGDIPDEVDMAVVIVPARSVSAVIDEAAAKGVKGLVVITGGFKEVGAEGRRMEKELLSRIRAHGMHMVGPNCLGVINTAEEVRMNASFAQRMPRRGNIAFISQSGALCTAVLDYAAARNIGFSKFISFGNKADVNEIDLMKYLRDDGDTEVIAMYLEDITDGREFIEAARDIIWRTKKPILAIKSGRSAEGAKAAASHTGSLAGSDIAYDCILNQSGILRVDTMNELFDSAFAFANQPVPRGRRIGIVTNAGGPGIMATDSAARHGLKLAKFSEETKNEIRRHVSPMANVSNPVDTIGYAYHEQFEAVVRAVVKDENVDGAIVMLTPAAITDIMETAQIIPNVTRDTDKPILCSFMGVVDVSEGMQYLEQHGVPVYSFPENPVRAMAHMAEFGWLQTITNKEVRRVAADKETVSRIIEQKLEGCDQYMMTQKEANDILQCYGFPMLKSTLVKRREEIAAACEEIMFPVAMKISSPDIVHKYDAGGVILNVRSETEAEQAFDEIVASALKYRSDARIQGVLIEKMARKGVEVILGASRDPKFGPVCMFGLGGTYVEAIKDVTFRVAPMWEISAEMMIREIRAYSVLTGIRGRPPSDIPAIKDCMLRLSQLVSDHPEIDELDINPLIVYAEGEGCVVADSRILLGRVKKTTSMVDEVV